MTKLLDKKLEFVINNRSYLLRAVAQESNNEKVHELHDKLRPLLVANCAGHTNADIAVALQTFTDLILSETFDFKV